MSGLIVRGYLRASKDKKKMGRSPDQQHEYYDRRELDEERESAAWNGG